MFIWVNMLEWHEKSEEWELDIAENCEKTWDLGVLRFKLGVDVGLAVEVARNIWDWTPTKTAKFPFIDKCGHHQTRPWQKNHLQAFQDLVVGLNPTPSEPDFGHCHYSTVIIQRYGVPMGSQWLDLRSIWSHAKAHSNLPICAILLHHAIRKPRATPCRHVMICHVIRCHLAESAGSQISQIPGFLHVVNIRNMKCPHSSATTHRMPMMKCPWVPTCLYSKGDYGLHH